MREAKDESFEKVGRVVFGLLAAAIVASLLWSGHREGRLAFAVGAMAASLVPGLLGVFIMTWRAGRRGEPASQVGIALGAFLPSAAAFAAALWASGEEALDIVMKASVAGFMIVLVILGAWIAVRGFPPRTGTNVIDSKPR